MKRFLLFPLLMIGVLAVSACEKIPAGHVGVKVNLYGSDKGVQIEELKPGRYWQSFSYDFFEFPTFTQNVTWENEVIEDQRGEIVFQTREGLTTTVDMGLKYRVDPTMVSKLFETYRKGIGEITEIDVRNIVRNAMNRVASRYYIRDIYGAKKTEFLDAVIEEVKSKTEPNGIIVEELFVVGTFFLPKEVYASINATQKAEQDALMRTNEIESTKAEALKAEEEARGIANAIRLKADAEAAANLLVAESLTPELIEYYRVQAWDGAMPRVTGGSDGMILDLGNQLD